MDTSGSTDNLLLGRGSGRVTIEQHLVRKQVSGDDVLEPLFMGSFSPAFARVLDVEVRPDLGSNTLVYIMPRYRVPNVERDGESIVIDGMRVLSHFVWSAEAAHGEEDWRGLLVTHLEEQVKKHDLALDPLKVTRWVGNLPPTLEPRRYVHGDATLANMVYDDHRGWVWVDPLQRPYVPCDVRVDLGKVFQTCWGYERVLLGLQEKPRLNERLAHDVVRHSTLDYDDIMRWCVVHLIRLLPYQEPRVRKVFEELLRDRFSLG